MGLSSSNVKNHLRFVVGRNKAGKWCLMDYVDLRILGTGKTFKDIRQRMNILGISNTSVVY